MDDKLEKTSFIISILMLTFSFVSYAFYGINPFVPKIFNYMLFVFLLIDLIFILITKDYKPMNFKKKLIYLFLFFNFVTILINKEIINSLKIYVFTCLQLLVMFQYMNNHKGLHYTILIFIFLTFFISTYGVELYFRDINISIYEGRHCGIYANPNIGGIIAVLSLLFSIIYFHIIKNKFMKICFIINIIFQLAEIVLCGSRASFVVMFMFIPLFYYFYSRVNKIKIIMSVIISFISISFIITGFYGIRYSVTYLKTIAYQKEIEVTDINNADMRNKTEVEKPTEKITQYEIEANVKNNVDIVNKTKEEVSEEKKTTDEMINISRNNEKESTKGRIDFILNGIKTGIKHPVFGVSTSNLSSNLIDNIGFKYSAMEVGGSHNTYVDLFVSNGLVGLIIFGVIILFTVLSGIKRIYEMILNERNESTSIFYIGIFVMECCLLVYGMFESNLFLSGSVIASLFWMCSGFLTNTDNQLGSMKEKNGIVS